MSLQSYIEHFRTRVLQDALAEATADYWDRRAETFAQVGNARCDEIARACRNRARLHSAYPIITLAEIAAAIRESA